MFEIVKMTHVCQYRRSTLISYPHLWSSVFVKLDHKDFVAACPESRGLPSTLHLELVYDKYCTLTTTPAVIGHPQSCRPANRVF